MVETVLAGLDRRRFPWVGEGRDPHEDEKSAAALATASLMATERVRTLRRNEARGCRNRRSPTPCAAPASARWPRRG